MSKKTLPKSKLSIAAIKKLIIATLTNNKAEDILTLDVRKLADFADFIIICTANSNTHAKALTDHIIKDLKLHELSPIGVEGNTSSEWMLIDFGIVVVHIMLEGSRKFYQLEKLWS